MKLIVGAPVAQRAWILPRWYECLARQTLPPAGYCFVWSQDIDATRRLLEECCPTGAELEIFETKLPFHPRTERNSEKSDPWRAEHMSKLRNRLRHLFLQTDADLFLSLDTDILLEDETMIEQLVQTLLGPRAENPRAEWGWDVVAPVTYLHPLKPPQAYCYNAGYLTGGEGFTQGWRRAEQHEVQMYKPPMKIDAPMAAFLIRRQTLLNCKYQTHECGEDIGFAQDLKRVGARVGWRHDLEAQHVWDERALAA